MQSSRFAIVQSRSNLERLVHRNPKELVEPRVDDEEYLLLMYGNKCVNVHGEARQVFMSAIGLALMKKEMKS